jgi:hypothetical protein
MLGLSPVELVALGVVALGLFSVLGVVAFKVLEKLLEPKNWQADHLESGNRRSFEERDIMRSPRGSLGDRLTAVERRLPTLKKPLEGDSVERFLANLPDVAMPPTSRTRRADISALVEEEE